MEFELHAAMHCILDGLKILEIRLDSLTTKSTPWSFNTLKSFCYKCYVNVSVGMIGGYWWVCT